MSGVITAVVGAGLVGSIGGAMIASGGAEDAANIQAGSANQANQLQYQMFQEQQRLMQPWAQSGQGNLARLNYAMYGQVPSAQSMIVDPKSQAYKNYVAQHPQPVDASAPRNMLGHLTQQTSGPSAQPTLYQNPMTGEISTTSPGINANQMGVQSGGLNPDWRFSTEDWKNSPEYSVYAGARDAALTKSQDALMAQGAASGMYGSGTMANQLSQNMGQLYAQYDPLSLQTAQQNAISQRQNQYNMMTGMASPSGAQQVGQWAGQYGQNAGQNIIGAGNAQAAGQVGAANAWGNALTSGTNQIANAYGQYQGQQNFNAMLPYLSTQYNPQGYGSPSLYQNQPMPYQFTPAGSSYQV